MANISASDMRGGSKVMVDGDPCAIIDNEHVKPGKGQAFNRIKLRNLKTGRVWGRTFKSGDTLASADIMNTDMEYVYTDGEFWYFMAVDGSFEQYAADATAVGDTVKWLNAQERYVVTLYNGVPLAVTSPNFIELAVKATDPGVKGNTVNGGFKPAFLTTGAMVRVPLFINIGDVLRVDTRSGEYVSRATVK